MKINQTNYLVIGAGIMGLTMAYYLKKKYPHQSITIIEKESDVAQHASGRNSGVLHAGLYYATDSLRAKYCKLGAIKIKEYCIEKNIFLNSCGKVIVAKNEDEIEDLVALYNQAIKNNVTVQLMDEHELSTIEPNAKTTCHAIYSPDTASFNAKAICNHLKNDLLKLGVNFQFKTSFQEKFNNNCIKTNKSLVEHDFLINCAGVYADKIAQCYGLSERYTLIPFKGVFLYAKNITGDFSKHIYPLPDKKIKLLGSHFSPEHDGKIKIGPTAVPCLSRENYSWLSNLQFKEMKEILAIELKLFASNAFNFRDLAINEMKKQTKNGLIKHSEKLVKNINNFRFTNWGTSGISPRLYDVKAQEIVDDFLIERTSNSLHIVNSVSPAFTASFAFSENIINQYL